MIWYPIVFSYNPIIIDAFFSRVTFINYFKCDINYLIENIKQILTFYLFLTMTC